MNFNMNFYAMIVILICSQIQNLLCSDLNGEPESKKEMENFEKWRQLINIEKIIDELKNPLLANDQAETDLFDEMEQTANDYNFDSNEAKRSAYLRFGRSPAFLRFGRNQAYLRFGKRYGKRYGNFGAKRNPTYLRFGRSVHN